ncbi:hypothetical protein [Armatimonas sp.]|uniref:hypothetical protein n=1 Tax=Armatimonas sp. TaxID=1872638 RepID=UPI00286CF05B|nr:hypothetical protein [Armatimonas sp.]
MPRRKKPSEIYLAWEKIVFGDGTYTHKYSPESQQAWAALWQQHCEGEAFAGTSIGDAALLCSLGYDQAAHQGDWHAAKERIERYFEHPQWQTDEDGSQQMLLGDRARACWACGDEDQALELFTQLVAQTKAYHRLPLILVILVLLEICQSQPEEAIASDRLIEFSRQVTPQYVGKRVRLKTLAGSTYGELAALLQSARTARESARTARTKKESQ